MTARAIRHTQTEGAVMAVPPYEPPPRRCEVWQLPGRSRWSPHEARTRVVEMCQRWGLAGPTADDLALIVSELTTNAVVHAPSDTICVQVTLNEHEAHVVVVDRGPHPAFVAKQPDNDEHGRGLCLVEALADRFVSMSAGDGTLAWASMNLA